MYFEWNWPEFWGWKTADYINLFDVHCAYQKDDDHSPGFHFSMTILNLKLLDFGYYNVYHAPADDTYRVFNPIYSDELRSDSTVFFAHWPYNSEPYHGASVYMDMIFTSPEHAKVYCLESKIKNPNIIMLVDNEEWVKIYKTHPLNEESRNEKN